MGNIKKNFERWRQRVPEDTAFLIDQVIDKVIPEFEAQGFGWYEDYAGGKFSEVGPNTIPLQRRSKEKWPTIEITFSQRLHPWFHMLFGIIESENQRLDGKLYSREDSIVCYSPAYFQLCKNDKSNGGTFGVTHGWYYDPKKKINSEIVECLNLLPIVFDIFDNGIPESWLTNKFGKVTQHIWLMGSWHINEQRRIARGYKPD